MTVVRFLLGLLLSAKGGDWFVDGAADLAHRFHIPEVIVGATVVSVGTTLPEVMVSVSSAMQGHGEIAYGNAVGSIFCNTALIAALTAVAAPGAVAVNALRIPVVFFFAAAAVFGWGAYGRGNFGRETGLLLLGLFVAYFLNAVRAGEECGTDTAADKPLLRELMALIVGAGCIAVGANFLVKSGTKLAAAAGVPESVIALTLVALGTSLPELTTAVTALVKGCGGLSLGNIVGANLLNLVLVSGLSMTLSPFQIPKGAQLFGLNSTLVFELPITALAMGILTLPTLKRGRLTRCQGISLLCLYGVFLCLQAYQAFR